MRTGTHCHGHGRLTSALQLDSIADFVCACKASTEECFDSNVPFAECCLPREGPSIKIEPQRYCCDGHPSIVNQPLADYCASAAARKSASQYAHS